MSAPRPRLRFPATDSAATQILGRRPVQPTKGLETYAVQRQAERQKRDRNTATRASNREKASRASGDVPSRAQPSVVPRTPLQSLGNPALISKPGMGSSSIELSSIKGNDMAQYGTTDQNYGSAGLDMVARTAMVLLYCYGAILMILPTWIPTSA
ncbi:hypothetical protein GGX14DRAFT_407958 [Mycena pura]|uniref:Uncharacterized protein n=1 Tax=Mycena pura TaxID=153505 RepID=A0AAD6Y3Z6_9AGAR|nr:hypothetical protein GGX14DRAFT_407958 [Mycena pura]